MADIKIVDFYVNDRPSSYQIGEVHNVNNKYYVISSLRKIGRDINIFIKFLTEEETNRFLITIKPYLTYCLTIDQVKELINEEVIYKTYYDVPYSLVYQI